MVSNFGAEALTDSLYGYLQVFLKMANLTTYILTIVIVTCFYFRSTFMLVDSRYNFELT